MEKIYAGSRRPNWPEELKAPVEIFKETDEGTWEGSTNIKGQYNNRIVPCQISLTLMLTTTRRFSVLVHC